MLELDMMSVLALPSSMIVMLLVKAILDCGWWTDKISESCRNLP